MSFLEELIIDTHNGFGVFTLNRPKALNALSLDMILKMQKQLENWEKDPFIHTVLIKSDNERAFCAGGDVKIVAEDTRVARLGSGNADLARSFFRTEYTLDAEVSSFSKPYVSFLNGIVMGGGAGISLHGSHRIATEKTKFAMPETRIGFYPDIGSGSFLSQCLGYTGLYLGMTGNTVSGENMFNLGLATHFVASKDLNIIFEQILEAENADEILDNYKFTASEYKHQENIDKYFGKDSVEEIFKALEKDKDKNDWCFETYKVLSSCCPTSLKVAFKHFHLSRKVKNISEIFKMDYRLSQNISMRTDFYEGVRAVLIDKTGFPKWFPDNIYDVKNEDVEVFFSTCLNGEDDLIV